MTTTLTPVFGDRTSRRLRRIHHAPPTEGTRPNVGIRPATRSTDFSRELAPALLLPVANDGNQRSNRVACLVERTGMDHSPEFFLFPLAGMGLRCTRAHGLRTGRTSQGAMATRHRRRGPGRGVPRRHDAMGATIRQDRAPGVHRLAGRGAPSRLSTDGEADQGTVSRSGAVLQRAIPSQSARLTPI